MADRGVGMKRTMFEGGNSHGFTLIEILIAIFLLVTALLGVISTTVIVIKSNSLSKTMTTATTLAKDKMEGLRNTSFNSIIPGGPEMKETIYSRNWTVTCKNGSGAVIDCTTASSQVVMKTIAVTVTWPWQGQNHTVTVDTIIAK
jgi:Tfp pilus assembly protein PilV